MIRKNLLLNGLAALCAGLLITACSNSSNNAPASTGMISPSGAKIGYVNSDSLFENYTMIQDLEEELIAEKLEMQSQFQVEYTKLEQDYMDAQKGAAQLSQEALAILQRRLGQREQELAQTQQNMEARLIQSENEKNKKYLKAIKDFVDNYGAENGYQIIYSYNGMGNVLYIDSAYDVTAQVLTALNDVYSKENEETAEEE
jgi:outer membrane protein